MLNARENHFCHSRVGGNPAIKSRLWGGQILDIDPLRGDFLINWIPACAGMTG